jgi:hypothetical protein
MAVPYVFIQKGNPGNPEVPKKVYAQEKGREEFTFRTSLPFGNRQVEVCQWDFPVGNRNVSIADSNVSVRNLDLAFKTVVFCGRTTECSGHQLQSSGWRRQISHPRPQFRVAGQGKLLSITGILLFVTGMLWSVRAMFWSSIGRSRLATGLHRSEFQKQDCTMEDTKTRFYATTTPKNVGQRLRFRHFCDVGQSINHCFVPVQYFDYLCSCIHVHFEHVTNLKLI